MLLSATILPTLEFTRIYVINDDVVSIFAIYWKETASVEAVPFNTPIIFWLFILRLPVANVILFRVTVFEYLLESYVYIAVLTAST